MSAETVSPQTTVDPAADAVVEIASGTPVDTAPDTTETGAATLRQVFAVLPLRRAVPDLVAGSWVLTGMGCKCVATALRWAWGQASEDPAAAAQLAAYTKRAAAVAKAVEKAQGEGEEEQAAALAELGAAPSGRRPGLEALAYLGLGGMLATGALATLAALAAPYLGELAQWRPLILTVGGLGWSVAAWWVAPPPTPKKAAIELVDVVDQEDAAEEQDPEEERGTALLWHVVRALADAESAGRAGLHLDTVLDSATQAGLIPAGTEQSVMRAWVGAAGLPTEDKVGMRIGGKPVTRVGFKLAAVTEALGMPPTALLRARSETPAGGAPAQRVGETPVETPDSTPVQAPAAASVPAVLRLIPGGRQAPTDSPSPALSKEQAQEAR
ncbi:hypothetical protein [Streptomyces sp. NBC_00304]|uniref:hypothetical protein n=1 Tax=Streptomyces sp. NBC_00304 TaxID=2975706 RepID=UPI002E29984F|nr:hypothetical protein [Streptomyces sp. NBC_00304]